VLHCHQTTIRRFREHSAARHAGTARSNSAPCLPGTLLLLVARHEISCRSSPPEGNFISNLFFLERDVGADARLLSSIYSAFLHRGSHYYATNGLHVYCRLLQLQVPILHVPKPAIQQNSRTSATYRHLKHRGRTTNF
jgi:hypothetical protein